eukprot:7995525-Pyramimonas_sp.AAC.1
MDGRLSFADSVGHRRQFGHLCSKIDKYIVSKQPGNAAARIKIGAANDMSMASSNYPARAGAHAGCGRWSSEQHHLIRIKEARTRSKPMPSISIVGAPTFLSINSACRNEGANSR